MTNTATGAVYTGIGTSWVSPGYGTMSVSDDAGNPTDYYNGDVIYTQSIVNLADFDDTDPNVQ